MDGARGPVLCLSPALQFLQLSPSDSTLKREFSLDAVAMTTLLTKTSFCGGGWLTQKLRVLGKGVHSDECICRAEFPSPTKVTQILRTLPDPFCFTGLWYPDPPNVSGMIPAVARAQGLLPGVWNTSSPHPRHFPR